MQWYFLFLKRAEKNFASEQRSLSGNLIRVERRGNTFEKVQRIFEREQKF